MAGSWSAKDNRKLSRDVAELGTEIHEVQRLANEMTGNVKALKKKLEGVVSSILRLESSQVLPHDN